MNYRDATSDVHVGPLQYECLQCLWKRPARSGTVREVWKELNARRDRENRPELAYTTVLTVMRNMHLRKILERERSGRSDGYRVLMGADEFHAKLVRVFVDANFDGDVEKLRAVLERLKADA